MLPKHGTTMSRWHHAAGLSIGSTIATLLRQQSCALPDDLPDKLPDDRSDPMPENQQGAPAKTPEHARPSLIPWPPMLLIAAIVAAFILHRQYPLPWPGLNDIAARSIGIAIGIGGIILAVWAIWTLYRGNTTVLPHKGADNLVMTGPFARLRNPIYVADIMLLLGLAELTKNIWLVVGAACFAVLVTFLAILPEERHLEARFGDTYRDYKARTRRWL